MKLFFCIFLFIFFATQAGYTQLKTFSFFYQQTTEKTKYRKLKGLPVKIDQNSAIYIHGKLIFEPAGESSDHYEILGKSYVFISFFDSSYRYQQIGFTLWRKGRVMIISIKDPTKKYFVDIKEQCRSEGVLKFDENKKLLSIKELKDNVIIYLPVTSE